MSCFDANLRLYLSNFKPRYFNFFLNLLTCKTLYLYVYLHINAIEGYIYICSLNQRRVSFLLCYID